MSSKTDVKENEDDQGQDTIVEDGTMSAAEVTRELSNMVLPKAGISTSISKWDSNSEDEIEETKEPNQEETPLEPTVDIKEITTKEPDEEEKGPSEPEKIKEPNKEKEENKASKISIIVLSEDDIGTTSSWNEPKEIFRLAEVQIYSINDDSSSAELLSSAEDLLIMEVPGRLNKGNFNQNSLAPASIQVGEWVSSLIPFHSPIYRSEEGHYIFPDPKEEKPGACTVLVIPSQTLGLEIDELESILKKFTGVENFPSVPPMMFGDTGKLIEKALEENKPTSTGEENPKGNRNSNGAALIHIMSNNLTQPDGTNPTKETKSRSNTDVIRAKSKSLNKDPQNSKSAQNTTITAVANIVHDYADGCGPHFSQRNAKTPMIYHTSSDLSTRIADGIMAGAEVVARGLRFGANKTSELIEQGTGVLKGSIDPASSPKRIHSKIHLGVKTVKNFTGKACEISGYVVQELSNITVSLALSLSPYLRDTTTTLVSKAIGNEQESSYLVDNVLEVTTGTFQGIQMVYSGLNAAAMELAKSITNNTVDVVAHCYGNQAGEIIDDAAETVGNIALTGTNTQALNPISVINHAAKDTGTVLLTKERTRTDYYHQPSESSNKKTD